jgi:hypothetical protein
MGPYSINSHVSLPDDLSHQWKNANATGRGMSLNMNPKTQKIAAAQMARKQIEALYLMRTFV